jgi:hypothetical protein
MICPKCNVSNDDIYAFCVECGTPLPKTPDVSSKEPPTVQMPLEDMDATLFMPQKPDVKETPPEDLDATVFNVPKNSGVNEAPPPTVQMPP